MSLHLEHLIDTPIMEDISTINLSRKLLLRDGWAHNSLDSLLNTPTRSILKPLSESSPWRLHINTLKSSLWEDSSDELPDGQARVSVPVIPGYSKRASNLVWFASLDGPFVEVGVEVKVDLTFLALGTVAGNDIQEGHGMTNVNEFALVDSKCCQLTHHRNEKCEHVVG